MDLPLAVDYASIAPDWYQCSCCGRQNVKLWREFQPMESFDLTCAVCTADNQEKVGILDIMLPDGSYLSPTSGIMVDTIGWTIPAIPFEGTEEGGLYYDKGNTPDEAVMWWQRLPNL